MTKTPHKGPRPVRTRIRFRVEVRGSRQSFDADARDVSVDGLCFSSPILMPVGDRAGSSLHLQGESGLALSFEVRWTRPEGMKGYMIGVEFVHSAETRKAMQRLMWQIESGTLKGDDPRRASSLPNEGPSKGSPR